MKYLPFRILVICLLLPPILYILTIQSVEKYLHNKYLRELENTYLGNGQALLEGREDIKDAVPLNINKFLASKSLFAWGVETKIFVVTKGGKLLYPSGYEEEDTSRIPNPLDIASENFKLMNEGIDVDLDLKVEHVRGLSNSILSFYLLASIGLFYHFYRRSIKKEFAEEQEIKQKLAGLEMTGENYKQELSSLNSEKESLISEYESLISALEKEKENASSNEEGMIDEIVALEEKIAENIASQEEQQNEIQLLKEELSGYEKGKTKVKASESVKKRFSAIYKNLTFLDKAIDGFTNLTENLKIKAEEVIHLLDRDPSLVTVKRKVFGKKGRETVFEVVFAYKGRLYYRRLKDGKIEIVTIGTKNVQDKDLEFLNKL